MGTIEHSSDSPLILLTGGTGYVGGRLVKALEASGRRVRCLARRPEFLRARVRPGTEVVAGDCLDSSTLAAAMAGVHTAYYLVHSMGSAGQFEEQDRIAARNFAQRPESPESGGSSILAGWGMSNHRSLLTYAAGRKLENF
jgi:uncharacterized protein YbjT (DUF2867 family)